MQPNGFYDIRMKKVSRHKKRRMLYSTHIAHNTIMFPIKAFCPLNISINAFFGEKEADIENVSIHYID